MEEEEGEEKEGGEEEEVGEMRRRRGRGHVRSKEEKPIVSKH